MVCRKVVILNGAEGHASCKGIVTVSDEGMRAAVKIDVFGLPAPNTDYTAAVCVDGRTAIFNQRGTDSAAFSGEKEWKVTPSSKIEAAVGYKGKLLAYGSNFAATDSAVKRMIAERVAPSPIAVATVTARAERSAREEISASPVVAAPPDEPLRAEAEDEPVPVQADAASVRTSVSPDREEIAPPASAEGARQTGRAPEPESEREPAGPRLTEYEESEARRRAAYDDEKIADVDFYPPEFETRIDRGRYVAHREAAAELDAWGGYNAVCKPRLRPRAEAPKRDVPAYYLSVKETLDRLFASAPAEAALNRNLSPSRWVRVDYREGLYYCVGLIGALPDYIGYAVPGVFSLNPPRQMAGLCKWLPLDREDPHGHGYWMMFQDAVTGAGVTLPHAESAV